MIYKKAEGITFAFFVKRGKAIKNGKSWERN
jgi:hypothetical protein